MNIGGLQKFTLLDYADKLSAVIFLQGCKFRCPYCHNPELIEIEKAGALSKEEVLSFLKTRQGKLEGVVISGGEPTLQADLIDFLREIKGLGYAIKLDTNGSHPHRIKPILDESLVDYVAMDIKSPLEKYGEITVSWTDTEAISESIKIIKNSGINHEFRTTVIKEQLSMDDFDKIGKLIKGARKYCLQKFNPATVLDASCQRLSNYSDDDYKKIIKLLNNYVEDVLVR